MYVNASDVQMEGQILRGTKWFIKAGTPEGTEGQAEFGGKKSGPILIEAEVMGFKLARFMAYFEAGNFALDAMPPIDQRVLDIFAKSGLNPREVFKNDFANSGAGVRFGAKFNLDFNQTVAIFKGKLGLTAGFDMSLEHFDTDCDGNGGGNIPGINGWYAIGQVYAGIEAELSIHVDALFVDGDFVIFKAGAAAALKAGLPNPIWVEGALGGYYDILDGLVSGSFHYHFNLGQKCLPASADPLLGFKLISSISPDSSNNTLVYADFIPSVAFNSKLGKEYNFTILDTKGDATPKRFRFTSDLVTATLFNNTQNAAVSLKTQVSEDGYAMAFVPEGAAINKKDKYTFKVEARLQEWNFQTNVWEAAYYMKKGVKGAPFVETRFTGGIAPKGLDSIPDDKIIYTYPFQYQRFYMPNESAQLDGGVSNNTGSVQFSMPFGVGYFNVPNDNYTAEMRTYQVLPMNNQTNPAIQSVNFFGKDKFTFPLPQLMAEGTYFSELVLKPSNPSPFSARSFSGYAKINAARVNADVSVKQVYKGVSADTSSLNTATRSVSDRMRLGDNEKRIMSFFFKVSKFNNFIEKGQTMTLNSLKLKVQEGSGYVSSIHEVDLTKDDVQQANTEGLKNVTVQKMNANIAKYRPNDPYKTPFDPNQTNIIYIKDVTYDAPECFDDYDLIGYSKTYKNGIRNMNRPMPPLLRLDNASVNSWQADMVTRLKAQYGTNAFGSYRYSTGADAAPQDIYYGITGVEAAYIPKLSYNEAIGTANPYTCDRDGELLDISFPNKNNTPDSSFMYRNASQAAADRDKTAYWLTLRKADGIFKKLGMGTLHLTYTFVVPKPNPVAANVPVLNLNFVKNIGRGGGEDEPDDKLSLMGAVYDASMAALTNYSITDFNAPISYVPPGQKATPPTEKQKASVNKNAARGISINTKKK
jgi:hypothetical protein